MGDRTNRRDRQKRVAGLILSAVGVLVTVSLAIAGSQEDAPSAAMQGLLAFAAIVAQIGASWLFSSVGRPDPALADRAVSRLFRSATSAQELTKQLESLFESKHTPTETHGMLGRCSVRASFLGEEIVAAIEDWNTFAPVAVAKTGALESEPAALPVTNRKDES